MKAGLRMTIMIAREAIIPIMGSMLISGSGCELPSGSVGGASISRGFRLALTFFGLSVFDDERTGVEEVARTDVLGSVAGAHRSLVIATLAVAVATCVAGVVLTANFSLWTAGISAVLAVVVAGRSRLSPLIAQKATLTAAGLVVLASFLFSWDDAETWVVWLAPGIVAAVAAIPFFVLSAEPRARARPSPQHRRPYRGRGRHRAGPLAVGAFDTYQRLIETF